MSYIICAFRPNSLIFLGFFEDFFGKKKMFFSKSGADLSERNEEMEMVKRSVLSLFGMQRSI